MEHTQAIEQLRREIRDKEEQLEKLETEQMKIDLTDATSGIVCTRVSREGMGNAFGRHFNDHVRGVVDQRMSLAFEVDVADGSGTVLVCVDLQASMTDDGDNYETQVEIGDRDTTLYSTCDWLYLPTKSDEAIGIKYAEELEEFDDACEEKFDVFAPEVKKCMTFLFNKREVFQFVD